MKNLYWIGLSLGLLLAFPGNALNALANVTRNDNLMETATVPEPVILLLFGIVALFLAGRYVKNKINL